MASEVWRRFGDVKNYVEPFCGSAAMLLARPEGDEPRVETINDADGHVANFWRALRADPDGVAHYADWPVSELDLHARGDWLYYREGAKEWVERLRADPDFYDTKSAGWWVWFISSWIGSMPSMEESQIKGWRDRLPDIVDDDRTGMVRRKLPHLGDAGKGVNRTGMVWRQLPNLRNAGMGVNRTGMVWRQLPNLGDAGKGVNRRLALADDDDIDVPIGGRPELVSYLRKLADRLRGVRVACGDWKRVTGFSITSRLGLTGVFLDPPYSAEAERDNGLYSTENLTVAHDVREWAIERGDDPLMRIALCGYDTEHAMPDGWTMWRWTPGGGYASQGNGRGRENRKRECIWFSPHCLSENVESHGITNGLFAFGR